MPNYLTDTDGKTPLRMWSNLHDYDYDFTGAIHLIHLTTGNSLCGAIKNAGVGNPALEGQTIEEVISCKRCLKIANERKVDDGKTTK